jgi:YD repeat-containing protein
VQGDAISQPIDGTTPSRTPTQTFAYDAYGNLTSYNNGSGTTSLTYDTTTTKLNRLISVTDPDDYTSYRYYYANGQISKTETAYQHGTGTGPTISYDADGNLVQVNSYHGGAYNSAGPLPTLPSVVTTTTKYYDGADRLVEVKQMRDPNGTAEAYTSPWITRYIYDLSQGHTVPGATPTIGGQTVWAYGNLFKTEELTPATDTVAFSNTATTASNTSFHELKGNAFDALDRAVTRYFYVISGSSDVLQHETYTYDTANAISSNNAGELASDENGLSQYTYYAYDNTGKTLQDQHTASPALDRQFTYDPDGRTVAATVPNFGTQTYAYDSDGRITQSAEPTSMESHATITYEYYADGTRKALDVSSALLTQNSLFAYAYRADGKLETQQINQPSNTLVGTTTLTFSYSNAGRLNTRSESGPGGNSTPTQFKYNASYGFLTETDFPGANKETNIQFDPSGAALGQTSNWWPSTPSTYSLTVRGEMRTSTGPISTNQPPPSVNIMANGVAVSTRYQVSKTLSTTSWNTTIDPRMGVFISSSATDTGSDEDDQSVGFDAIGRATEDLNNYTPGPSCDTCQEKVSITNRGYDQENHVITTNQEQCGYVGCAVSPYATVTYDWGAEGHPIRIGTSYKGSATAYETLHWAGNQLLFTTHGGVLDDIKVGEIGDITPQDPNYKGVTFWDRDVSSNVVYCHNATGAAGNGTPAFPYSTGYKNLSVEFTHNPCQVYSGESMAVPSSMFWGSVAYTMGSGTPPLVGSGGLLTMPRGDGFNDGFNILQGVRIYDSTLGGWATPDAYQGDVHDPMSQKSYVWNRDNASTYADPAGFDATNTQSLFVDSSETGSGDANALPDDGQQAPTDYPTASSKHSMTMYEALKDIAEEAAGIAVDNARAEKDGYFSGDQASFLKSLTALVQSGMDYLGIKGTARFDSKSMTVSARVGPDSISLDGNANGLHLSISHSGSNPAHQQAIVISTATGANICWWGPRGEYSYPVTLQLNIDIKFHIGQARMFDPYLVP